MDDPGGGDVIEPEPRVGVAPEQVRVFVVQRIRRVEPPVFKEVRTARIFYPDPLLRIRSSEIYLKLKRQPEAIAELRLGVLEADAVGLTFARVQLMFALAGAALTQAIAQVAHNLLRGKEFFSRSNCRVAGPL